MEIFLKNARFFLLPLVEWIKTVAQAIPNGKYRTQETEFRRKDKMSSPEIGCQTNSTLTYFRSLEWIGESLFVTV